MVNKFLASRIKFIQYTGELIGEICNKIILKNKMVVLEVEEPMIYRTEVEFKVIHTINHVSINKY